MAQAGGEILVIRLSSLGDLVLMIPLLRALRAGLQGREVHLLCKDRYSELFAGNGLVDRMVTVARGDLRELVRLHGALAHGRYGTIIDAHNVIRSNLLFHTLRAKEKLQIRKNEIHKSLLIRGKINLYKRITPQAELYLEIARRLGLSADAASAEPPIPEAAALRADTILEQAGYTGASIIALAPGARWQTKRWPKEYYCELLAQASRRGYESIIIGGAEDTAVNAEVARAASRPPVDCTGKLSILESAAVLKRCAVLVTNDSAPLHLAEAVGTPVVAFYGPTVREFGYFPRLASSRALEAKLDCRPCSRNGARPCPYGTKECLTAIKPHTAFDALSAVLEERRVPA